MNVHLLFEGNVSLWIIPAGIPGRRGKCHDGISFEPGAILGSVDKERRAPLESKVEED